MLGNLSLLNQTSTEVQEGRLAFKLVLCAVALTRALHPPQWEPNIIILLKTHSLVCTIHILVIQVVPYHQIAVDAAGLQMHLFQVIIHTIIRVSLVEVMCQSRQLMKYHSASLMGSGFLKSDLLVFEGYQNYQMPHMQVLYKVRYCEKARMCMQRQKINNSCFTASSGLRDVAIILFNHRLPHPPFLLRFCELAGSVRVRYRCMSVYLYITKILSF